jgi:hypothetical protein
MMFAALMKNCCRGMRSAALARSSRGTRRSSPPDREGTSVRSFLVQLEFLRRGTLAPFFRASDSPIAIACFRLFTRPPLPPRPDRSVPRFRRPVADFTDF